jgi:hypothetical protein
MAIGENVGFYHYPLPEDSLNRGAPAIDLRP